MPKRNQARKEILKRMIDLEMPMGELARKVKHPRESVSRAVNQGQHPKILTKVREVLGV
jgi:hypothetical protein